MTTTVDPNVYALASLFVRDSVSEKHEPRAEHATRQLSALIQRTIEEWLEHDLPELLEAVE